MSTSIRGIAQAVTIRVKYIRQAHTDMLKHAPQVYTSDTYYEHAQALRARPLHFKYVLQVPFKHVLQAGPANLQVSFCSLQAAVPAPGRTVHRDLAH